MASRSPLQIQHRRGFSILEILVAVGIVLAIAAVAVPWTLGWLGSRELDDAGDRIAMQMLMARAAAREEGRPVEVVASAADGSPSIEARWVELDGADVDDAADALSRGDIVTSDGYLQSSIDAEWASFALPSGLSIDVASNAGDDEGAADGEADNAAEDGGPRTLALFLPDGTVLMAPIFMLRTDAGVARAMRVDRATGRARAVEHEQHVDGAEFVDRPEFDAPELDPPSDGSRASNRASNRGSNG